MKRILNNIGAISKQAIVGGAIGVATLMVGIGLMNNFSSNSEGEQGFASNAVERSYSSYDSSYSGTSADDILSARNYAQGGREGTVSAITGSERLAVNRKVNAQNAVSSAESTQADIDAQDNTQGYGDGEIEGMGTSNKVDIAVSAEDEAAAKAQRDAKIAKGQALGDKARATLKTSKMADGSGIKGLPTGSTSMTYGTLGSANNSGANGGAAIDSSKVALAKANMDNLKGANGKLGAMGSNSKEADGKRGRASIGQNYEAIGDLGRASKYSRSGKEAVNFDAAQGAADAAAAFDGSKDAEAINLEGENLQKAAVNSLQDMGAPDIQADLNRIREDIEKIDANMEKWSKLMDQYAMCIQSMILIASIAAVGMAIATKFGYPGLIAAAVMLFIAWAGLLAAVIAANVILGQVADLAKETGYTTPPSAWDWAMSWLVFGGLSGLLLLAGMVPVASTVGQFVINGLGALGGGYIVPTIKKMLSLGKEIKASKEAEEAAREIQNQTDSVSGGSSNSSSNGNITNSGKAGRGSGSSNSTIGGNSNITNSGKGGR